MVVIDQHDLFANSRRLGIVWVRFADRDLAKIEVSNRDEEVELAFLVLSVKNFNRIESVERPCNVIVQESGATGSD